MLGHDAGPAVSAALDRLARRRFLVVSGKGGVGRTTVAALLGLACAERGKRVLVATTGHDDRLAWMLGRAALETAPMEVEPGLFIQRLDPQRCIVEYGALVLPAPRMSQAMFDNRVVRRLLRAIPGLDDFALLGKAWHEAVRTRTYDLVVFDGPATGHLRYVLGVPDAILSAVPRGPLTREAELIQASLQDAAVTAAVLVGLPEPWPLTELGELSRDLEELREMQVGATVVNDMWPDALPEPVDPAPVRDMLMRLRPVAERGRARRAAVDAFWKDARGDIRLELPSRFGGIEGREDLDELLYTLAIARASTDQVEPA